MPSKKTSVLILGGGFAGLSCALALPAKHFDVTVIDQKPDFEFLPAIHELVSRRKTPASLRLPLKSVLRAVGHRFLKTSIEGIDPPTASINTTRGALSADYLVVALGAQDNTYGVAGVGNYAHGFKSVAQCSAIGAQLKDLLRDDKRIQITIIGAGFEGIEAAGEVLRVVKGQNARVAIVDGAPRLIPTAPESVSSHLAQLCEAAGVELILGSPVAKITPKTVCLSTGEKRRSDLTIWTGGSAPPITDGMASLTSGSGWLQTSPTLNHPDYARVFVIGDNADALAGVYRQAYHAIEMGEHCASNIQRQTKKRSLRRFKPSNKPQLISFGELDTVLIHPRRCLSGTGLSPLKEAIYQAVMAKLDRRKAPTRLANMIVRSTQIGPTVDDMLSSRAIALRSGINRLA